MNRETINHFFDFWRAFEHPFVLWTVVAIGVALAVGAATIQLLRGWAGLTPSSIMISGRVSPPGCGFLCFCWRPSSWGRRG